MRTVVVRNGTRILLGKQGENNAVRVVWPEIAEKYTKLYGDGRFELVVVQKGQAYPAVVNVDGPDLIWNVLTADVATVGAGSLELIYYVGDTIAKSQTWETLVEVSESAEGTAEPPEPAKNWVDKVLKAGQAAVDASVNSPKIGNNGNWWVWDFKAGAYVDTGVAASGGVSAVYSVNGQTGMVELTAKDVGAISQDDLQEATNEALAQAKASGEFDGPAGSDATVTAENIQSALGYTPADSADVSAKLDKPATPPEVGKILKVTAVNEDGSFVCEWANAPSGGGAVDDVQVDGTSVVADGVANIPLAKMGSTGVVKFDAFMPFTFNAGALRLANADESELTNPRYGFSTNRVITAANYRLAVKLAMCDGIDAAWTDAEKTGAWKRLTSIKTAMDAIAVAGAQYYLGEQTAVDIVFPDDAQIGQMITFCWYNGATAATLSITGTMLAFNYTPSANTRSEINALWDGTYWAVLGNEMEVPSDAETT